MVREVILLLAIKLCELEFSCICPDLGQILCCTVRLYSDGVDNTVEENSSIFSVLWMC